MAYFVCRRGLSGRPVRVSVRHTTAWSSRCSARRCARAALRCLAQSPSLSSRSPAVAIKSTNHLEAATAQSSPTRAAHRPFQSSSSESPNAGSSHTSYHHSYQTACIYPCIRHGVSPHGQSYQRPTSCTRPPVRSIVDPIYRRRCCRINCRHTDHRRLPWESRK